jgi:amino acid transporter
MGGEIKNPRKTVPWAIFFAGITVAFCYIIGTLGVLVALPSGEVSNLQGLVQAVAKTVERVGYGWTLPVAAFLICLSNVSAAGAYLAAVARLPCVAGIDRFLPPAFGHLHPRWKTPCVALLTQYFIGVLFIFLGQAGTTVKGAYDVMASMTVIVYFIPYLYVFASMIKLQNEPAGPEIIRVPGGKPVAVLISIVGLIMTTFTIVISVVPQPDDPNKPLAVLKVAGGSVLLFVIGAGLYWNGKKRAAQTT